MARPWEGIEVRCLWADGPRRWPPHDSGGWRTLPCTVVLHSRSIVYDLDLPGHAPLRAGPGSVLCVPEGQRHRIRSPQAGVLTAVHLTYRLPGGVDPLSLHAVPPVLGGTAAAPIGTLLRRIAQGDARTLAGAAAQQAAGLGVLHALLAHAPVRTDAQRQLTAQASLAPAVAAMRASLAVAWTPAGLARRCGLSRAHFCRAFRATTGRTPMAWLRDARLARACILLLEDRSSVGAVAEAVGFCDPFHFSRVFARAYGLPPTVWRRRTTI